MICGLAAVVASGEIALKAVTVPVIQPRDVGAVLEAVADQIDASSVRPPLPVPSPVRWNGIRLQIGFQAKFDQKVIWFGTVLYLQASSENRTIVCRFC